MKRIFQIVAFVIVFIVALILVRTTVAYFIDKPPTLNAERAKVFNELIDLANKHQDWDNSYLSQDGSFEILIDKEPLSINLYYECCSDKTRRRLGDKTIIQLRTIADLLKQTSTMSGFRSGKMFLFYLEGDNRTLITMHRPGGFVYSPQGIEPNEVKADPNILDTIQLQKTKPLHSVGNGWYSSKNMTKSINVKYNRKLP